MFRLWLGLVLVLLGGGLLMPLTAQAADGSDFNPGHIIADSVFTASDTMTVAEIQNFLNSKMPECDTDGSEPYAGTTRAQYGSNHGAPPPYVCLKDYSQGGKSAAQIIWEAGQTYQINPRVLIVLLQKEQGLVTDEWPWPIQYRSATGYGCPDGGDCNSDYYGFTNQVHNAARMFRKIMDQDPGWYTPYVKGANTIKWHPNSSCGTSQVNILNWATAALYNYTPYRPNPAALANLYGSGDGCSSYGNRNFWRDYSDWFGSTQGTPFFTVRGGTDIYMLGANDNYYHLNSTTLLKAYGYPSGIATIDSLSTGTIKSRTFSGVIPRIASFEGGEVYLIDRGIKHLFPSDSIFEGAFGYEDGDEALLPASSAYYFPRQENIGRVVVEYGGSATYSMEGGQRRHLTSGPAMETGDPPYSSRTTNYLTGAYLATLPKGPPIFGYGTLLQVGSQYFLTNSDANSVSVPSAGILSQYGLSFGQATALTTLQATGYPSSGALGFFVKKPSGSVWLIQKGGKRRYVTSDMLAASKYNLNVSSIPHFPDSFIASFKANPGLTDLIQSESDNKLFVIQNGVRRRTASWATLNGLGYDESDLTIVSPEFMDSIPRGTNLD